MNFFKQTLAAAAVFTLPMIAQAAPALGFGQPFLVIDGPDTSGSILNFFGPFGPSDREDTRLSGTISTAIGTPSLVGKAFDFEGSETTSAFNLALGTTTVDFTFIDLDPFQAGPGDLNISLAIQPPFIFTNPDTFDYTGDFDEFPTRTGFGSPEFEVKIAVFLDGPLPTKFFDDGFGGVTYVEGALSIDRIEFATADGAPLPAAVPLPATGILLLVGLGGLTRLRKRHTS